MLEIIRKQKQKCATHSPNNNDENKTKNRIFQKEVKEKKNNVRNRMRLMKCSNFELIKKKDFMFCY